jgi:hypothetical protein
MEKANAERHRANNPRYYRSHLEYFAKKARDRRRRMKHDLALALHNLPYVTMTADALERFLRRPAAAMLDVASLLSRAIRRTPYLCRRFPTGTAAAMRRAWEQYSTGLITASSDAACYSLIL